MNKTPLQPPRHLSSDMAAWWRHVVSTYRLEPHHVNLLRLACEAFDEAQKARAVLEREGFTIANAQGAPRSNPAVAAANNARITYARLLRELDLDHAAPPASSRPPGLASNRRPVRTPQVLRFAPPDGAA
jgi:P27 family predicted phage terminase small subunit